MTNRNAGIACARLNLGEILMTGIVSRLAIGLIVAAFAAGSASAQGTGSLPDYLAGITGTTPQTPAALATIESIVY